MGFDTDARSRLPYPLQRVGARLLAKNSQAPRSSRRRALSLTFFASKLAPTRGDEWPCGAIGPMFLYDVAFH
ncbi:hypothetical protein C7A10_11150 [Pseudomonas fluorescens]|uniref:Uncharacterized protein n=1 Tax=Pseudomonas fluorescens TaxID=294 RepID=A0A2T0ICJ7_PSEFL|nr:hypothetical protein C7A10_11150 [Pseudomonas fluorescens]